MSEFNRNPLHTLGEFSWADYAVFKAHLRLPRPYLYLIFRNYKDMHSAVLALPKLVTAYADHLWEKKKMTADFKDKVYQSIGIPPQFHKTAMYTTENAKDQGDVAAIVKNAGNLKDSGVTLYFYSEFAEGAMHAASEILRKAVDSKLTGYCASYPNIIEVIKQWDLEHHVINKIRYSDVLVLWNVGCEYTTEFTTSEMSKIMVTRRASNLTTIVVSNLTPKAYLQRYGMSPEGTCVGFKDHKLKQTLSEVRSMLEGKA